MPRFATTGATLYIPFIAVGSLILASALFGIAVPASATVATSKATAPELAAAKTKLLQISDLHGKWTQSPYGKGSTGTGGGGSSGSGPGECDLPEPGVAQNPAFVNSPYFDQKGSDLEVQEEINVFPNSAQALKDLKFGGTVGVQQCFIQVFNQQKKALAKSIGKGVMVGNVTAKSIALPTYGQGTSDIRVSVPIIGAGSTMDLYEDNVVVVQGRFEALIDETNFQAPISSTLAGQIDQVVANKL